MKLRQVALNWEALARRDAFGAILTERSSAEGPWSEPEFFASGGAEWRRVRERAQELGLAVEGSAALDFGCGVGRITRHLASDYSAVDGVDVAPGMVETAGRLHAEDDPAWEGRLRFLLNTRQNLAQLPDGRYDLVFSLITLQHLPPALARGYIAEFFRVSRPGGTVFFQVPTESHPSSERLLAPGSWKQRALSLLPARLLEAYRMLRTGRPRMDMFGLAEAEVEALIGAAGGELLAADAFDDTGGLLPSRRYFARRTGDMT